MKASTLPFLTFSIGMLLASCGEEPNDKIVGLWQETAIINPQMDAAIHDQQVFADTVGNSTTAAQNRDMYGVDDIDTFRASLKTNLDSFRRAQFYAVKATKFDFRKDGIMYIHSQDGIDSSNWYFDEDGALILDEAKLKGDGGRIRMEVLHLSDTMMKLQFTEKYLTSTAVFKPVRK